MKHVLYFSASWCAPCKTFAPQFNAVLAERQDVGFQKVNIDDEFELARSWGVRNIPCLVITEDGKELSRLAGANVNKTNLEKALS
jgi:thiol-disulfide isomerase/thioredoxin